MEGMVLHEYGARHGACGVAWGPMQHRAGCGCVAWAWERAHPGTCIVAAAMASDQCGCVRSSACVFKCACMDRAGVTLWLTGGAGGREFVDRMEGRCLRRTHHIPPHTCVVQESLGDGL